MSIRKANGPSFVGCQKIVHLIESGPGAVERWLDGLDASLPRPDDYNGWSGVAFQLAHAAQASNDRDLALAFGTLACRVYEGILPGFQNELACVGLGCGGALTKVEGMQLRIRMIERFGHSTGHELLDPEAIVQWFDCCEEKFARLETLARRDLTDLEVEEVATMRFAKNRIAILRALPAEALAPDFEPWIELYDVLP